MSKEVEIRVPDIGDFTDIPVVEVLVKEGQSVAAEQSLVTLESDKAVMEIPAPSAGTVASLNVAEGDLVSEGALVAVLRIEADAVAVEGEAEPELEPVATGQAAAATAASTTVSTEEPATAAAQAQEIEDDIDPA